VAEHEEQPAYDALLAAIMDTPPPDEARQDPGFLAEHRAATADVALLREQLALIGEALADPPGPAPRPVPVPRRRFGPRALKFALAAAVACGMIGGLGWLVTWSGSSADSAGTASAKQQSSAAADSDESAVICARLIVEGTVIAVEPVPGTGQDRIELKVTRYYKPAKGSPEITFVLDTDAGPRLRRGDHTLVAIPRGSSSPDTWLTEKEDITRERARITAELGRTPGPACE